MDYRRCLYDSERIDESGNCGRKLCVDMCRDGMYSLYLFSAGIPHTFTSLSMFDHDQSRCSDGRWMLFTALCSLHIPTFHSPKSKVWYSSCDPLFLILVNSLFVAVCTGTCALCLAIGGFMSWVEDPTIQCVALLLQVFGCGYWIICAFYFVMVGQAVWAMIPFILLAISLGSAFTRGPGYVFEEDDSLETPFWVVTGIILGLSLIIGVAGVLTMNDEKRQLVERMKAIKKYVADNKDYKWPGTLLFLSFCHQFVPHHASQFSGECPQNGRCT